MTRAPFTTVLASLQTCLPFNAHLHLMHVFITIMILPLPILLLPPLPPTTPRAPLPLHGDVAICLALLLLLLPPLAVLVVLPFALFTTTIYTAAKHTELTKLPFTSCLNAKDLHSQACIAPLLKISTAGYVSV